MARKKATEYESGQNRTQVEEVIKAKKRLAQEAAKELEALEKGTAEYKEQLKQVKELNKEVKKGTDLLDKGLKTHQEHQTIQEKRYQDADKLHDLSKNITKSAMKQVGGWKQLDSLSAGIAENAKMGASFQLGFSSSGEDLAKSYGMTKQKLAEVGGHFEDIGNMQQGSFDLSLQMADQWDKIGTDDFSIEGMDSQIEELQRQAIAKKEQIKQMAEGAKGVDPELRKNLMEELKVLEDTTKGLQEKGQEMTKLDMLTKSATAELVGPFEKMQGVLKSMPMGGFINDYMGLDKVVSDFGKNTAKSMKVFLQSGGTNTLMLNNIKNEGMAAADAIGKGFTQVAQLILANPIMILVAGLALAGKMMWDFAAGAQELHSETGLAYGESARLHGIIKTTSMEMTGLGVSSEDVRGAAMGIADHWGGFGEVTKENVKNLAMLQTEFGISGSTAADLAVQMQAVGAGSKGAAIEQMKSVSALAQANGVAPAQVMEEVAQNSELFSQFAQDGGKNVFKAAIQAKKLGVSMDSIAQSADALLEFESSIESQMEASMLIGRNINTDKARQLAFEGDLAGMQKEILKQAGSEAEWNKLNVVQRKAMAAAFGLGTDEMSRMIANQEKLNNMSTAEKNAMEAKEEIIQKLKKAWSNIVASVTKLWPVIVGFASPLLAVVGVLGFVLKIIGDIAGLFGELGTVGNVILGAIGAWVSWSLLFGKSLMGPINMMGAMLGNVNKILFGEKAITLEKMKQTKIFQKISGLMGGASDVPLTKSGKPDKRYGKRADKTKAVKKPAPGKTTGKGGGGPLGGMFEKFDAKKALGGAAALLIISAALFVTAKALQEFGKVNWGDMGKAGVALLGLTLTLAAIGAIMMSGVGALAIVAGAGAMLIMAAALLVLGVAIQAISKGMTSLVPVIQTLAPMSEGIFKLAGAFTALGVSMGAMALGALALIPALPVLMTLAAIGALGGNVLGGGGEQTAAEGDNPVELKLGETNSKLDKLIALLGEDGAVNENLRGIRGNTGDFTDSIMMA